MRMDRYLPPEHPLSKIYRAGAAIFGVGLLVFGILGLVNGLPLLTTDGMVIFGLATNGLLAVISIVVGGILVAAAAWGGAIASTTTAVIGVLFFLSGLGNLLVLDTSWNLLAFQTQNVVFSLIAGSLLMSVGFYGRFSGGLPQDNPYKLYRRHEPPEGKPSEQRQAERQRIAELNPLCEAEIAFAEGHATPQQERQVRAQMWQHAQDERRRAYAHYREAKDKARSPE